MAGSWSPLWRWPVMCLAVAAFWPSKAFLTPRQLSRSSKATHVAVSSKPLPSTAQDLSSRGLSLGLALAAVAMARKGLRPSGSPGRPAPRARCVALCATATKKDASQELAKKSEVPADLDWSQVSSQWEVDCFSRPIMRDGKKMWELMVTDANGVYRRVAQMKPTRVNSVVVQKLMTIFIEESKVKPQSIRFFRKVMKNMLIVALNAVKDSLPQYMEKCKVIPSRNCHMLRLWLSYRDREVYPKMMGYSKPMKKKSTSVQASMVKMAYEKLPERIRFTRYAISAIPLGALARVKPGQLPGQLARIPPGFSDNAQVYGILILTSRADIICSTLRSMEMSAVRVDLETDELLMELDIDTTYKIAPINNEEKEGFLKFERSKRQLGGLHFVAVHDIVSGGEPLLPIEADDMGPGEGCVTGLWTLIDYTMQEDD
ncbi:unnamed protein product [Effrenium voratum]|nr:unnamed protein product [Effrenium voratum]